MQKRFYVFVAALAISASALAADMSQVARSIPLKDGSTLYIFKDGKMGMEDRLGRAVLMAAGTVMETKDGKKIAMVGNELWRVEEMLHREHRGP